ncbi:MAG: chain length determinant protein EpsF [Burkholderiales bacterium]
MTFSQFLSVLRARLGVFVTVFLVTVVATAIVSLIIPKQYTATTTLVIDTKGMDPVFGVMLPAQLMPGYLATQVDIVQSHKVAVEVVRALRFADSPVAREQWQGETDGKGSIEDWFADVLLKKLDVKPSRESSVIEINFTGSDPQFAAAVANAFASAYQRTNLELRVEPARQSSAWFDERLQQLSKKLEEAQIKLNEYQREKGFTAQDDRFDLESSRLTELSMQYTSAQAQAADALSRSRQLNEYLTRGASPETIPDVLANPLVQNLKSTLSLTEGRLQQTASQLGSNHPEVKRLEADIAAQRAKLKSEISQAAASLNNAAKIAQKREGELKGALAEQKSKFLRLNQGRDQLQLLMKEVEAAQRAYDTAAQRFQQTNLESQASVTNVSILTKAFPPIDPSFPKLLLNMVLSVLLGLVLGVAVVLVAEMMNRRVRTSSDFADAINAPVLGAMLDDKSTRRSARRWRRSNKPANTTSSASGVPTAR